MVSHFLLKFYLIDWLIANDVLPIVLIVQVEQISKEQNYQRYREERFRLTSESTNQRVLW